MSKFSVKKPYTVLVAVIMVIVLGIVSFWKMSADLLPNINLPYVIVMTTYVGASPETVEMVVTKPIESAMATVSNIENISSVSSENYSLVTMEFAQSADMDSVSLEIRESLDQIKSYWDDSVGNPIIGDYKYGNKKINDIYKNKYKIENQMLHSWELVFPNMPEGFEALSHKTITAELPKEFVTVMEKEI